MKKIVILAATFCLSAAAFAQTPQKMSYQAVVRNSSNVLVTGVPVGMRISVLQGSPTGTAVFVETHTPNTNANGLVSLEIGGGTVVSGSFAGIDWANGPYFIQTETDPAGGSNYTITGTSQFLSVPYALYAETSGTPGPQGPAGATGAQGAAGNDGAQGVQGIQGPVGASAYQVWLNAGNTGTEADFLASLVGPQGVAGVQGIQGAQGVAGPVGPQGPAGNDGAAGAQGPQGAVGPIGVQGVQGIIGPQGVQGTAGLSAYQVWLNAGHTGTEADFLASLVGAQGTTGVQGPQGVQGTVGPQGPVGNTGAAGLSAYQIWLNNGHTGTEAQFLASLTGATGAQGPVGNTGAAGAQGPVGNTGATGPQGPIGNTGATGAVGPQGPVGNTGATGAQGPIGNTGATGAVGAQGPIGNTGAAGVQGISAYQVWLNNGHTGTEADFLASLVGATGTQGPVGNTGATGATGPQGPAGPANAVQSYCAIADATVNSEVSIGGLRFRANTNGTVEVMSVSGYPHVQVYSVYRTYSFEATTTAPSIFVIDASYNPTGWTPIARSYNYSTSTYSPVNMFPAGIYTTYDCEISILNYPAVMPTKSFRMHAVKDGYNNVLLRVEYFP